ncbi:MAG TPA: hypothetical protein VH141_27680 [Pseudonocardia sp.]|jgi:hypothetical protein|nr:hypothetical protein [Pseudonocardia sp.]
MAAPAQRTIFIATGPRTGQHIRIDTPDGILPDPIAFPDPLEADDSTEGVRDVRRVDADSPDSTSYKLIVVTQGSDCPPMYYQVVD